MSLKRITQEDLVLDSEGLKTLPYFDNTFTSLFIAGCDIDYLPEYLPESIIRLFVGFCKNIKALPTKLPDNLQEIVLQSCPKLVFIPEDLPNGLEKLEIIGCNNLRKLTENFPLNLKVLNIEGALGIVEDQDTREKLLYLEARSQVIYPYYFNMAVDMVVQSKMDNLIEQYVDMNPSNIVPQAVINLIDCLLCEILVVRESVVESGDINMADSKQIAVLLTPFLQLLEDNPDHFGWIEKIAAGFSDELPDDPVKYFTQICSFVSIARVATVFDKISTSSYLVTLEMIEECIIDSSHNQIIDPEFEDDARNLMLNKIYYKLNEEDQSAKSWLGITRKYSYHDTVLNWANDQKVEEIADKVRDFLSQDLRAITQKICSGNDGKLWRKLVLPELYERQIQSNLVEMSLVEKFLQLADPISIEDYQERQNLITRYPNTDGSLRDINQLHQDFAEILEQKNMAEFMELITEILTPKTDPIITPESCEKISEVFCDKSL